MYPFASGVEIAGATKNARKRKCTTTRITIGVKPRENPSPGRTRDSGLVNTVMAKLRKSSRLFRCSGRVVLGGSP